MNWMTLRTRMTRRLERYFLEPVHPRVGFAVTRDALTGIVLSKREPILAAQTVRPLPAGLVEPSFDRPNLADPDAFDKALGLAAGDLGLGEAEVLLLLPESCFKAYVLAFDEFPAAAKERDELLSHRLAKVLPVRPPDLRMSYDVLTGGGKTKVFLALTRASIVDGYERAFARRGLRIRTVTLPSLGVLQCVPRDADRTVVVVNVEDDSIGLLAAAGPDVILYRFKPFLGDSASPSSRLGQVMAEIQNTLRFLEDREGRKADVLYQRGLPLPRSGTAGLEDWPPLPLKTVESPLAAAAALAPLLGHLS